MAPSIGMQMKQVLLGLSSGLQLGQRRYAGKVNQWAGMGGRGRDCLGSDWFWSLISLRMYPVPAGPHSKINSSHVHGKANSTPSSLHSQFIHNTLTFTVFTDDFCFTFKPFLSKD